MVANFLKFKISNLKYQKGFSLLELLVSLAIISMLIGVFLANYRGGTRKTELAMAAQKLASDVRFAQSNGLGSAEYANGVPDGGWGIYFEKTVDDQQYLVFADLNANKKYDSGEAVVGSGGSRVDLPSNVSIYNLKFGSYNVDRLDITFVPPDPLTNIYNSTHTPATTTAGSVILRESYSGATSTVDINSLGLIEVN
jgi:prepilin-type N-terminal cleavage/methylation domain-containing protein